MAGKRGRPPGSQNKAGRDEKEFIKGLLGETQEQFRKEFIRLASACNKENPTLQEKLDRVSFLKIRQEMSKMVVPKPLEVDTTLNTEDFEKLMAFSHKWDDEAEDL